VRDAVRLVFTILCALVTDLEVCAQSTQVLHSNNL